MTSASLLWEQNIILNQNQPILTPPPSNQQDSSQLTSTSLFSVLTVIFIQNQSILTNPSNHHYFFQMTLTRVWLSTAQTIILNQNQLIRKQPQIIIISLNWPLKTCFHNKPSFSITINQFINTLEEAAFLSNDPNMPVFNTSHHFQPKATDSRTQPLRSSGFLSNDPHNCFFSTNYHF